MDGTFTDSVNTLAELLTAIPLASELDWAISLQSGPFREFYFVDDDDCRNVLHLFREFGDFDTTWFRAGILPMHAPNLILDEWSYYLGFDASRLDPLTTCNEIKGNVAPRHELFQFIAINPCVYIIHVDDWWWEAYTNITEIQTCLRSQSGNRPINSSRWDGRTQNLHPFPENAR